MNRDHSKDFKYVFQINRKTIFTVAYYYCGSNDRPYFATSAAVFNQPKTDFIQCGQCQPKVLSGLALQFYKKWDYKHLQMLSEIDHWDVLRDIQKLKNMYNCIRFRDASRHSFYAEKELSKLRTLKKTKYESEV